MQSRPIRWTHFSFALLAGFALATTALTLWPAAARTVAAQEKDDGGAEKAADNGGNQSSDAGDEGAKKELTALEWVTKALGYGYLTVFLLISFTLVTLLVMNLIALRRDAVCPMALVEDFEGLLNEKKYSEAFELASGDESFLGQVLAAGLNRLSKSYQHAFEAMQEVAEDETMKLEHRLSYLALIGTISPMVGLFGTVDGMIRSFSTIAVAGQTPSASKLAEGISTALFTTLLGLAIAIPAIILFNILKNRLSRLVLEVGIMSENLMSRFEKVGGKTRS